MRTLILSAAVAVVLTVGRPAEAGAQVIQTYPSGVTVYSYTYPAYGYSVGYPVYVYPTYSYPVYSYPAYSYPAYGYPAYGGFSVGFGYFPGRNWGGYYGGWGGYGGHYGGYRGGVRHR